MTALISVHVPKAGGTSIGRALENAFGGGFLRDYLDDPARPLSPRQLDPIRYVARQEPLPNGVSCVHGHFHPGKYKVDADNILFTMLRHPVDNIISIYFFWKGFAPERHTLHEYVIKHKLTLLEMAQLPILRDLFSQTYFGGFEMRQFHVIGRHEAREPALLKLSKLVGLTIDHSIRENATPRSAEREEVEGDRDLRHRLTDILAGDIKFYERYAVD